MMKLSLLITATERVTGPVRRIQSAIGGMVKTGTRDVARLDAIMAKLGKTAHATGRLIGSSIKLGALAAAAGTVALAKGVMDTGIQFENFETTLTTTLKSASKAKSAMSWIQDFAERTPFELAEVTKAFVNLNSFSIVPTDRVMTSIADTAAVYKGMGKTMDDVVQAVADAQNGGGFERLKEFGVQGSKQGHKVFLTYSTASGRMRKQVTDDANAIREAVLDAFDAVNGGGAARMANTFEGRLGNLADVWTGFKLQIAEAGIFDWMKDKLGQFLNYLNTATGKAARAEWAKKISDGMIKIGEALIKVDWGSVATSIVSIGTGIAAIGTGIASLGGGGLEGMFNLSVVGLIVRTTTSLGGLAAALGVVSIAGLPLWAVVAGITAVAAGAFLVWRNWDKVSAFFTRTWQGIKQAFVTGQGAIWNAMPAWMRGIMTGARFVIKFFGGLSDASQGPSNAAKGGPVARSPGFRFGAPVAPARPLVYPQRAVAAPAQNMKGAVTIRVQTDPGTRATVSKLSSNNRNFNLDVTRGRVMVGGT